MTWQHDGPGVWKVVGLHKYYIYPNSVRPRLSPPATPFANSDYEQTCCVTDDVIVSFPLTLLERYIKRLNITATNIYYFNYSFQ